MSTYYPQEPGRNAGYPQDAGKNAGNPYYPQEQGKNTGNPYSPPPMDPYSNPMPPSQPYGPPAPYGAPSQPYGPPAQPYGPPSQPYGEAQAGPIPPPQYQQYPAGGQAPFAPGYPPPAVNYGAPPPTPPARSNGKFLIIGLVALVIIVSLGAIIIPYERTQTDHSNATATASTHATTVSSHATGTAQAIAQATAEVIKANPNPYPPQTGTLVALAKMPDVKLNSVCNMQNNVVHAINSQASTAGFCWGGNSYENFAYDVEVTIIKGDCGGIIFREDSTQGDKEYLFNICQNGIYSVDIDQGAVLKFRNLKYGSSIPGLHMGVGQTNLVGVVAQGQNFSLYVNKQLLTTFSDGTYGSGLLGLDVWDNGNVTEVSFANQRVWKL